MADIVLTCPTCAAKTTASEFAEPESVICSQCGVSLKDLTAAQQHAVKNPKDAPRLGLRKAEEEAEPEEEVVLTKKQRRKAVLAQVRPHGQKAKIKKAKLGSHVWGSAIFFIVVGGAGAYWRYGGMMSPEQRDAMSVYGPWVLLAFHLMICGKAYKDSVFQGFLCVFVPFYSLYYLLLVCDDFWLRAVTGAVLVPLGQDGGVVIYEKALDIIRAIHAFIAGGAYNA